MHIFFPFDGISDVKKNKGSPVIFELN
jgi:hypothetical protein